MDTRKSRLAIKKPRTAIKGSRGLTVPPFSESRFSLDSLEEVIDSAKPNEFLSTVAGVLTNGSREVNTVRTTLRGSPRD